MSWILESTSGCEAEYDDFSMAYWAGLETYGDGNFRIVKKEAKPSGPTSDPISARRVNEADKDSEKCGK